MGPEQVQIIKVQIIEVPDNLGLTVTRGISSQESKLKDLNNDCVFPSRVNMWQEHVIQATPV